MIVILKIVQQPVANRPPGLKTTQGNTSQKQTTAGGVSAPKLADGFEKTIIGLEFKIEKGQVDQAAIAQLIAMYTMAADHYDQVSEVD